MQRRLGGVVARARVSNENVAARRERARERESEREWERKKDGQGKGVEEDTRSRWTEGAGRKYWASLLPAKLA